MDVVFQALTNAYAVIVICLLIFGWCGYEFFKVKAAVTAAESAMDDAIALIDRIEDGEGFYREYDAIDSNLKENALLAKAWGEYRKTIIDPDVYELQVLHSPYQSEHFFSTDLLLGEQMNLSFYGALPNFFTGAGILGTFVGLVAGISLAQGGLADPTQGNAALQHLLDGASLSFMTSIAGLVSSIGFSIYYKGHIHLFENKRKRFTGLLDRNVGFLSLEKINKDELATSRQRSESMNAFFEQVAFNLTQAMSEALDTNLKEPLLEALGSLTESIDRMQEGQDSMNEEMLNGIVEKFSSAISGTAGEEMREFSEVIRTLGTQMNGLVETLGAQQASIANTTEESARLIGESFANGAAALQQEMQSYVAGMNEKVGEMADRMQQSSVDFGEHADRMIASAESMQEVIEKVEDVAGVFDAIAKSGQASHEGLEKVSLKIEEVVATMSDLSENNAGAAESIGSASEEIRNSMDTLVQAQEQVAEAWRAYEERFAGVDETLGRIFGDIDDGMERYSAQYAEFLDKVDQYTANITKTLAAAIQQLGESVEELNETMVGK